MPHRKLFLPDEALVFLSLPQEARLIQDMGREFNTFVGRGYANREALYCAYVITHRNGLGIATTAGAAEFYRRMTEYLRAAMDMVEEVIADFFHPFADRLPAHNAVSNCLNPVAMLHMATTSPGANASSLERRRHFEAIRQLGIALQLFAIENVDGEETVAEDLSSIDELTWQRLFTPGASIDLWLLCELDPERHHRATRVHIFANHREAKARAKILKRSGALIHEEFFPCRVAPNGKQRYLVMVENRRKRLFPTLLKLERGRPAGDRRGWKYVVTGVQNGNGTIRVAGREEATTFNDLTRDRLWIQPLLEHADDDQANPGSNEDYWDVKVVGRFHREEPERVVAGLVEQIAAPIQDHVNTRVSTDTLNHDLYRAEQVRACLGPLWFPHRRGPYNDLSHLRLPSFGVDWDAPYFQEQLERWWRSQL